MRIYLIKKEYSVKYLFFHIAKLVNPIGDSKHYNHYISSNISQYNFILLYFSILKIQNISHYITHIKNPQAQEYSENHCSPVVLSRPSPITS